MDIEPADPSPLELLARTDTSQDPGALRRDIARRLLDLARGERPLERASQPGDLAAAFLRRYAALGANPDVELLVVGQP